MSVYLLENHLLKSNFARQGDKFGGDVDLILQDETWLATGKPGATISCKRFPWKVLYSVTSVDVTNQVGFNLHIAITTARVGYEGRNTMNILLRGDFLPILNHVFDEVPTTMEVYLDIEFRFGSSSDCISFHVLESKPIINGESFSVNTNMNKDFADRLLVKPLNTLSVFATIKLFGKDWIPICLKTDLLTTPPPQIHDDLRTRNLNKKLLEGKVLSDFALVADNGFAMPCHKPILQLSSPFFERMFQTECQEMKENKCKLDLSEEGLKALLEFLYFSGIEGPTENSAVAMELLEISHELQIPELEQKLKELLMQKPVEELDLDGALQLFLRCTKLDLDGYDDMKEKAMNVLKMKKKELRKSSTFTELMETKPKFAIEFFSFFI